MNIFTAPSWDIDEASAAFSSSAFGGSIPPKIKKRKSKSAGKQSGSTTKSNSTIAESVNPRFARAKQLRRLTAVREKAKEVTKDIEGNSVTFQSKTTNDSSKNSDFKTAKKIDDRERVLTKKSIKSLKLLKARENKKGKHTILNPQNGIDKSEKADLLQTMVTSASQPDDKLTKKQKKLQKRKLLKMKKKAQFNNAQEDFLNTPAHQIRDNAKKAESNGKVQSKLGKLLELQKKRKKAEKFNECTNTSLTLENGNAETSKQKVLALKLKKKEKRLRKKNDAVLKKLEKLPVQNSDNKNEVVLSNSKKKKMRKIAQQLSQENLNKITHSHDEGQGTANPSFNESLSESTVHNMSYNDGEMKAKIKRKKKNKMRNQHSDSVDGNLSRVSNLSSPDSSYLPLKKHAVPAVTDLSNEVKKAKKKKMVVAKLLQEANIVEKTTLHDLKKKRQSPGSSKKNHGPVSLREKMADQLKSARFRWLNEQLYSSDSWEAHKYFKEDPEAYEAYHSGYRNQVAQWPVNPLDVIIKSISSMQKETVVADFGCGDARLAETLSHFTVHSFDLVAKKPGVTACDMAHTPLLMESVDVAVFCLSLMGKNLNDFILEANRVLKAGGLLLIAEVESRFDDIDNFTSAMVHFGFQLKKKDISNQMFIFMDFKKTRKVSKTGKLPALALDPCVYKKR